VETDSSQLYIVTDCLDVFDDAELLAVVVCVRQAGVVCKDIAAAALVS